VPRSTFLLWHALMPRWVSAERNRKRPAHYVSEEDCTYLEALIEKHGTNVKVRVRCVSISFLRGSRVGTVVRRAPGWCHVLVAVVVMLLIFFISVSLCATRHACHDGVSCRQWSETSSAIGSSCLQRASGACSLGTRS
jgi:hypothetical protein